jgi:hypothetical protein
MHKPLNASLFSVIDLKASHWFEPSQAHCIFEFRFLIFDLARCGFFDSHLESDRLKSPRT